MEEKDDLNFDEGWDLEAREGQESSYALLEGKFFRIRWAYVCLARQRAQVRGEVPLDGRCTLRLGHPSSHEYSVCVCVCSDFERPCSRP